MASRVSELLTCDCDRTVRSLAQKKEGACNSDADACSLSLSLPLSLSILVFGSSSFPPAAVALLDLVLCCVHIPYIIYLYPCWLKQCLPRLTYQIQYGPHLFCYPPLPPQKIIIKKMISFGAFVIGIRRGGPSRKC